MVKFRSSPDPETVLDKLQALLCANPIGKIEQVFPGNTNADLSSLYEVTLEMDDPATSAIESLSASEDIEYAHEPTQKHPS